MPVESREEEVSALSHRIGLSGANKTMLHLLKKAKVQLIKIDQQKQLKLSQVTRLNSSADSFLFIRLFLADKMMFITETKVNEANE